MNTLILLRRHALMLAGLAGLVLLGGCGHPSSAASGGTLTPSAILDQQATQTALSLVASPAPDAPTTTPPTYPPTVLTVSPRSRLPTATPPSPSPTVPTATRQPSSTPGPWSSPTADPYVPLLVKALPLDQPWLLAPEDPVKAACYGVILFAIDQTGSVTQLDEPVSSIIPRPGKPPLIMTCPAPKELVMLDPLDGSRVRLIPDPVWGVPHGSGKLSPQGDEMVVEMVFKEDRKPFFGIVIFNLHTGESRVLFANREGERRPPFYMDEYSAILGWRDEGIYLVAREGLWRIDPAQPDSPPMHLAPGHEYAGLCSLPVAGDYIACGAGPDGAGLYNLQTGEKTVLPGAIREVSLAPDGTRLVYTRPRHEHEVVLYDLQSGKEQILETGALSFERGSPWSPSQLRWSNDGQRLLLLATSAATDARGGEFSPSLISEALIFTADGAPLARASFPLDAHRSVSLMPSGELLVVQAESYGLYLRNPDRSTPERGPWRGERLVLRWVDPGLGTPLRSSPVFVLPAELEYHGVAVGRVSVAHSP